ncbi:MAG: imidazolonepropionase [Longimicrobiales bacterium]
MSRVLFTGASEVVTCTAATDDIVMRDAAVLVVDGHIRRIGSIDRLDGEADGAVRVDCAGCVITPGFVDSHTHAVFGGWRAAEYAMRCRGVPYMEIAKGGGGINASVRDIRARSEEELLELARPRIDAMLAGGTTTAEVKSGYGLDTESELKQLRVVRALQRETPIGLVPTFLGAHEFPPEYRARRDEYVDLVVNEMIPAVAEAALAVFCDVFMEPGVFTAAQTRRILEAGSRHGLTPKLHADELENAGAAELAVQLGAASADHLGAISDEGIAALAKSDTVATLLPATLLFLGRTRYAPARRLIDAGATVALATDFNPGSSPTPSMQLVLTLACSQMRMDPLEAIVAATAGGARALRLTDGTGTLAPGAPADLAVWDVADHRELPYRYGAAPLRGVWKRGQRVGPSL